jgi:hypothetical protein
MPEQSLISESLSRILGMQPGGGGGGTVGAAGPVTAGIEDQSGITLGKGPLSYIAGAMDQFGMGSAFGQQIKPSTVQTTTTTPAAPAVAAPPANPLTVAPSIPATAPKPAAPAPAPAPKPAAPTAPAAPTSPFVGTGAFKGDINYYNNLMQVDPIQATKYAAYINAMNAGKAYTQ